MKSQFNILMLVTVWRLLLNVNYTLHFKFARCLGRRTWAGTISNGDTLPLGNFRAFLSC